MAGSSEPSRLRRAPAAAARAPCRRRRQARYWCADDSGLLRAGGEAAQGPGEPLDRLGCARGGRLRQPNGDDGVCWLRRGGGHGFEPNCGFTSSVPVICDGSGGSTSWRRWLGSPHPCLKLWRGLGCPSPLWHSDGRRRFIHRKLARFGGDETRFGGERAGQLLSG